MTDTLKVLGQVNPSATTLTTLYTVPGATSTVVTFLSVCNTDSADATFRVSIQIAGAGDNIKQYIYYDHPIAGKGTFRDATKIGLATTDVVKVYASTANLSFTISGLEVT